MALLNFNATSVAPNSAFDPLQPGWYHVKIIDSETKPVNPPKTGSYLALTMEVIEGPAAGRKLFLNLNLENENPVAVRIAYENLSALCYVTGQIQCNDSQELHGIPFQAKVTIRAASGNYDASNDVKGFRNAQGLDPKDIATGGVATPGGPAAPPQPPAAPSAPSAPSAPAVPGVPAYDPMVAAKADGWAPHPTAEGWLFKGADVKSIADTLSLYPAPAASVSAPAAPVAPSAPAAPRASATAAAAPPWAKPA